MTEEHKHQLEERIAAGYPFNSSQALVEGLRLYRAYPWGFAGLALLLPLLSNVIGLMPIGEIPGMLLTTLLLAPVLNAGHYLVANKLVGGKPIRFTDFFEGRHRAGRLIMCQLIYTLIMVIVLVPTYLVLQRNGFFEWYQEAIVSPPDALPEQPELAGSGSTVLLLNLIPFLYLAIAYVWTYPLILFFNAGPWQALEYSRRLVTRRWGSLFFLLMTFVSIALLASMLLSVLSAVSMALANVATLLLFLITPWVHCSLYAGFTLAMQPDPDRKA